MPLVCNKKAEKRSGNNQCPKDGWIFEQYYAYAFRYCACEESCKDRYKMQEYKSVKGA